MTWITSSSLYGRRVWHLLGLCLLLIASLARGEGVRLAIIGGPELEKESLLLSVSLSANANLEIVERSEIAKVFAEQSLERQGFTARDGIRLGALLKADGLVLMERSQEEIRLRIVAVNSGAIVAFLTAPIASGREEQWSSNQAMEIARVAPKLSLPRSELIPISLMQINSAVGGTRGTVLEENVYSLLSARFSADPRIVVLERARLQDAVAEKEFGAEQGAFWNSAWVIDGTVTELPSGLSLDLRLQPPGGDQASRIQAEGSNLAGLVEEASGKVLQTFGGLSKIWNPAKEAERFGDEAIWAASNGLLIQATRAIEAAIALGESSPEALRWRWQCYERLAKAHSGQGKNRKSSSQDAEKPGAVQIGQMTRCLELYQEALLANALPKDEELENGRVQRHGTEGKLSMKRFGKFPGPNYVDTSRKFPGWEGCSLLRTATRLILDVEGTKGAVNAADEQALVALRRQIQGLFDAMVATLPGMTLTPCPDDRVPAWNSRIDPETSGPRNESFPGNIHTTRLVYGRVWVREREPHFAYVRQCLLSDLPGDPDFFQRALQLLTRDGWLGDERLPRSFALEKRKWGESLIAANSLRSQVAGSYILCWSGAPTQGLRILEQHKAQFLNNNISVDYIMGAFRFHSSLESLHIDNPGESLSRAAGVLRDLVVYLLDHDAALSSDVMGRLGWILFTERQATELLTAFKAYQSRHPLSDKDPREWAVNSLLTSLTRKSGAVALDAGPASPPAVSASRKTPRLPQVGQGAKSGDLKPLLIEKAWMARNYNDANEPGAICYALPAGDKIWLQVEFQRRDKSIRRQFLTLDLPSLKSKVLHREVIPAAFAMGDRVGPTFASDGEGVNFWNGRGISYARAKEVRALEVPDLKRPFLWLVDGFLYTADEDGVLLKINPETSHYEILASSRRRPPQNALDSEKNLPGVTRIYRGANGGLAVKIENRDVYIYSEAERNWTARSQTQLDVPDLLAAIDSGWEEAGRNFTGIHINELLKKRAPEDREQGLRSLRPALRYLPVESRDHPNDLRLMMTVKAITGVVSKTELKALLGDHRRFWLLDLNLSSDAFVCREVNFSPAYQAAADRSSGPYRLIPTASGVVLYAPNAPVLWFVPVGDISPAFSDGAPSIQ